MDEARIICGDAKQVLSRLPADSVDLTVTSPPYYRHRDYRVPGQFGMEATVREDVDRIGGALQELFRVTKETGACFLVVGDTY
jgi:site-specific DNA-methyltransferase (adenine-specific)